ncbi:MAG: MotA/TolQ/ExbB proton channel family protein [Planctomycetes bacterium]|nr:MotA/TolQ/ExbB proton channel family protein [Planctomycetota bacterium]
MLRYFFEGGLLMWPILACLVVGTVFTINRLLVTQRGQVIDPAFVAEVFDLVSRDQLVEAEKRCSQSDLLVATIFFGGIRSFGKSREVIKEHMQEIGGQVMARLQRHLSTISTVASVSPLLGLLGTVTGIIKVFRGLGTTSEGGLVDPQALAPGIAEALITTAAGLMVAIPMVIAYRYLNARIESLAIDMEQASLELANRLVETFALREIQLDRDGFRAAPTMSELPQPS